MARGGKKEAGAGPGPPNRIEEARNGRGSKRSSSVLKGQKIVRGQQEPRRISPRRKTTTSPPSPSFDGKKKNNGRGSRKGPAEESVVLSTIKLQGSFKIPKKPATATSATLPSQSSACASPGRRSSNGSLVRNISPTDKDKVVPIPLAKPGNKGPVGTGKSKVPLVAKRRLPKDSSDPSAIRTDLNNTTRAVPAPIHPPKLLELPDYEDAVDEDDERVEDMEFENPMPEILKIVKNDTTPPHKSPDEDVLMEIDSETIPHTSPTVQPLIVVPDTNIWINDMGLIDALVKKDSARPIQILIPWMVLQELDVGYHRKNQGQSQIRKPIRYIYSQLSCKNPRIKGQKAHEAALSKLNFDELVADDSILNCALLNQDKGTVLFLSNDKNLLSKAMLNDLIVADSRNALNKVNEIIAQNESTFPPAPVSEVFPIVYHQNKPPPVNTNERRIPAANFNFGSLAKLNRQASQYFLTEDVEMQEDVEAPACKVRATGKSFSSKRQQSYFGSLDSVLVKTFSHIIRLKMIEDFGMGGWEYALKIKSPWTLATACKCMLAHWVSVFSFVFSGNGQRFVESLRDQVERYRSSPDSVRRNLEEQIVETAISLFNLIDKNYGREAEVMDCKRKLVEIAKFLHETGA